MSQDAPSLDALQHLESQPERESGSHALPKPPRDACLNGAGTRPGRSRRRRMPCGTRCLPGTSRRP